MIYNFNTKQYDQLRNEINKHYLIPEEQLIPTLVQAIEPKLSSNFDSIKQGATKIIQQAKKYSKISLVQKLMQEFSLSSEEGLAMMCLAEALLRIPDKNTQNKLIKDKLNNKQWYNQESSSLIMRMASVGLNLSNKILQDNLINNQVLSNLLTKLGGPLIHKSMHIAMQLMGKEFVIGEDIEQAVKASKSSTSDFLYSFDMLGEAAITLEASQYYFSSYKHAIETIGKNSDPTINIYDQNSVSIKLSALHPRYSYMQPHGVQSVYTSLKELVLLAKHYNIGINIDAEETDRLDISLDLFTQLCHEPQIKGWNGLGFVVQAYQKRSYFVLDYLIHLAEKTNTRLMIRLVKGAYWDSEIKNTQIEGLENYPVFTRKFHTDINYLACADKLIQNNQHIYPQFATHNALTIASIMQIISEHKQKNTTVASNFNFEFQCLYGMGEQIYQQTAPDLGIKCRMYAPVGKHDTLLPYLVRRLLENGANTSFVNQLSSKDFNIDDLTINPIDQTKQLLPMGKMHDKIALPTKLYEGRKNSIGLNLADNKVRTELEKYLNKISTTTHSYFNIHSLISDIYLSNSQLKFKAFNPSNLNQELGEIEFIDTFQANKACLHAAQGFKEWTQLELGSKCAMLNKGADLIEQEYFCPLIDILMREAGKTLKNAINEIREAVDFLRYYSINIDSYKNLSTEKIQGLGVVTCISPWNFPLAIFIGQISAALIAGNSVIAKPAEQTSIVAHLAVQILHQAGVPKNVLQLVLGMGETIGDALVKNENINGIIFTGSIEVAKIIQKNLATRLNENKQPVVFIAETGGQNAMIIDSSCLIEQTINDILVSAFDSAGQRCSALRVLYVQDEIFEKTKQTLQQAITQLSIGEPTKLSTDIGCVIDQGAYNNITNYINQYKPEQVFIYNYNNSNLYGYYCSPAVIYLDNIKDLSHEIFGPVLHVVKYDAENIDKLADQINELGYGLTFGVHSRIDNTIDSIKNKIHAGNIYINRNTIGAIVGVQPFGGEGLSGTGPKAGGPLYLGRLLQHNIGHNNIILNMLNNNEHTQNLSSYTGEENTYSLSPKTKILCLSTKHNDLQNQLKAVASINGQAIILNEQKHMLESILSSFTSYNQTPKVKVENNVGNIDNLGAVLINFSDTQQVIETINLIAMQYKHIVPIITPSLDGSYSLSPLMREQSISNNTVACGGNASLLTI